MTKYILTISLLLSMLTLTAQTPMSGTGRPVVRPDQVDSLFYWFDATDASTITTNNGKVTQWDDKSGNGYNVVQADTSKAPTLDGSGGPNSQATMGFDGTDDILITLDSVYWQSDDITVFVVAKFDDAGRDVAEYILNTYLVSAAGNRLFRLLGNADANNNKVTFAAFKDGGVTNANTYFAESSKSSSYTIITSTHNSSLHEFDINGSSVNVTPTTAGTGDGSIADLYSSLYVGQLLLGSISEIIVYSSAISATNRQGIEAYLSSKYNLKLDNNQSARVVTNRIVPPTGIDSLFYWFDAEDATTLLDSVGGSISNGERVSSWADKSGRGWDVTQAQTDSMPIYSTTTGPGSTTAALTFDGTSDYLASAAHWWGSDDMTVFVVYKVANATRNANEVLFGKWDAAAANQFYYNGGWITSNNYTINSFIFKDGGAVNYVNSLTSNPYKKSTSWRAATFWHSSSDLHLSVNGVELTYAESVAGTGDGTIYNYSQPLVIGGLKNTSSTLVGPIQGSISEIIVYSKALTPYERRLIETYLNDKYQLY